MTDQKLKKSLTSFSLVWGEMFETWTVVDILTIDQCFENLARRVVFGNWKMMVDAKAEGGI